MCESQQYEDYQGSPTRKNANEFIQQVREEYIEVLDRKENYLDYMAHRPGVQLDGEHGLWDINGKVQNLSQAVREVAEHTGNVWTPVVAIRREDAERLGYDNAQNWRELVNASLADIAKGYKIHPDHLRWYAAFHEKEKQVHIHMVVFSTDPREGYLTTDGIRSIRGAFARQIFRQELISIYEQKSEYRSRLQAEAELAMAELIRQMRYGGIANPRLEQLIAALADQLKEATGRLVYGYLPPRIKSMINEIVDELAKDERVASAYELWNQMREELCRIHAEEPPERLALSQQRDFKPVRNMVIREVLKLNSGETFPDDEDGHAEPLPPADEPASAVEASDIQEEPSAEKPPHIRWSDRYKNARTCLYGSDHIPQDHEKALKLFQKEAMAGNALAMCDLGRMYADGLGCEPDAALSHEWYARALAAFLKVEQQKPNRYVEYRIGKLYASGLGAEQDYAEAADWFGSSAEQSYNGTADSAIGLLWGDRQSIVLLVHKRPPIGTQNFESILHDFPLANNRKLR